MKAYGIPRVLDIDFPDIGDIKEFGMQSHVGQLIRKSGDYHSYIRSSKHRRSIRRYWKRVERGNTKRIMYREIHG